MIIYAYYIANDAKRKAVEETYGIKTTLYNLTNAQMLPEVSRICIGLGCALVVLCSLFNLFFYELPNEYILLGFCIFFGISGVVLILTGSLWNIHNRYDYNNEKVYDKIRDDLLMAIAFSKIQMTHEEFLVLALEVARFCDNLMIKDFSSLAVFLSTITITDQTPPWLSFVKNLLTHVINRVSTKNIFAKPEEFTEPTPTLKNLTV